MEQRYINEFNRILKERNVYSVFWAQAKSEPQRRLHKGLKKFLSELCTNKISELVMILITWSQTELGATYWNNFYYELKEKDINEGKSTYKSIRKA